MNVVSSEKKVACGVAYCGVIGARRILSVRFLHWLKVTTTCCKCRGGSAGLDGGRGSGMWVWALAWHTLVKCSGLLETLKDSEGIRGIR